MLRSLVSLQGFTSFKKERLIRPSFFSVYPTEKKTQNLISPAINCIGLYVCLSVCLPKGDLLVGFLCLFLHKQAYVWLVYTHGAARGGFL